MTVSLRPATDAELAAYLAFARDHYISERIRAGDEPAAATRNADQSFGQAFPGGRAAAPHLVFRVERDGEGVGTLWIGPRGLNEPRHWWVWDIVVDEAFRGQGIGRATMLLAESEARGRGAVELGLNVFGHNQVAEGLYRSLGYEVTATQMRKLL
ncbi:MAG TPA: GNAT family N-acetyltransferase [Candidatus Dormibacteraeota bacterium]|nr:GNAT family N-acetyltransferase [Candidatus Dormibacteraeota bacterium]